MTEHVEVPKQLNFSISSRTARLLGRENISNSRVALLELVKNAYDADASRVDIFFRQASTTEGEIVIADDGTGMTLEDLVEKWMVIGTDSKRKEPISLVKKRVRVGEKGVGRLALDRLASLVVVETQTNDSDSGLRLTIDWDRYDSENSRLGSVGHPLEAFPSKVGVHGTSLRLHGIRDAWSTRDTKSLIRDLSLLVPPLEAPSDFSVFFHSDENPELDGRIITVFPELAEFTLKSALDGDGLISHRLIHRTGIEFAGQRTWDELGSVDGKPRCGPIELDLYYYLRESRSVSGSGISFSTFTRFLDEFKGVRVYRDYMRVKPYGEPADQEDWLGLNARRAASPAGVRRGRGQWRVASNQVIGSIFITRDGNPDLVDQTNREGMIENGAFTDLRRFVHNSIQFLELRREEYEQSREPIATSPAFEEVIQLTEAALVEEVSTTLTKFPDSTQINVAEEVEALPTKLRLDDVRAAHDQAVEELLDENRLLAGLASLGIALVAFGHETPGLVSSMWGKATLLGDASEYLPEGLRATFDGDIASLKEVISRVEGWAEFALKHINRDKRTRRLIDINQVCESTLQSFSGLLQERSISVISNLSEDRPSILGFAMDFESIMLNFLTNSIEAMRRTPPEFRLIKIETQLLNEGDEIIIRFGDSGRGIHEDDLDHVFDPMFSTKQDDYGQPAGTGLGLTIVRTTVARYGGRIEALGHGECGGATFSISIPTRQTG